MANSPAVAILIVNDRPSDLVALREALNPLRERILVAESAAEGLRLAEENDIAVAIVDIRMPAIDGFAMVESLRRDPKREGLPVIFATAFELTPEMNKRVYQLGAVDVVPLPAPAEMLLSKVGVFVRLHRQQLQLREYAQEATRAAATEVYEQQERLRLFVETVSDYALFFLDPVGLITEWTVSAERLLGYPAPEVVGKHFRLVFTPEDQARQAPERELEKAITTGEATDDREHVRLDGVRVPVAGRLVALKDQVGTLRGFAKIMRDASQLRALQRSEAKFREIFETANEGIWILSPDLVIETANKRMAEILGYGVDEVVGRKKFDFVYEEDVEYIRGLFDERRSGRVQPAIEVRFRHKDGRVVWTLMSARPLYHNGQFAGALDMFTDITQRRLAENRFRVFFESSAAGHALIDPSTRRFMMVNRRYCQITGRTAEELRASTFVEVTHPDDRQVDLERTNAMYRGERNEIVTEKRYVRPDGAVIWVHLTTTVVRAPDGHPEVQVSVVQDITARKAEERELVESRTRLRLAIEAAELGVFYHDGATHQVSWNQRLREMIGLPAETRESTAAFLERLHPDDRRRLETEVTHVLAARDTPLEFELEYRVLWPDGTVRWLRSNGLNEPDTKGYYHVVGTVFDVTTFKEFEAELRRQIAERTRELEEKTRQLESFCYTVAHDLRAPLRAINGYADFIREEVDLAARPIVKDYLDRIRASTQRLDALINDLLAYARIEQLPLEREPVDLRQVTDTVLLDLASEIERKDAEVVVRDGLPKAVGEQSTLQQIVYNLVSNALKFTQPGQRPRVEIFATDGDGRVRLHVQDRGIGIAREYHSRIFRVFERLQSARAYPGTGIGLAIVAKGIERLGGTYGVDSEPGKGSTFWIELKRADAKS